MLTTCKTTVYKAIYKYTELFRLIYSSHSSFPQRSNIHQQKRAVRDKQRHSTHILNTLNVPSTSTG